MNRSNRALLPIPDKSYFTISEVAKLCGVTTSVLRFWEKEFSELNPSKGRGSRRYYQQKDIAIARKIRELLYDKRFTIEGAQKQLRLDKKSKLILSENKDPNNIVSEMIVELQSILAS